MAGKTASISRITGQDGACVAEFPPRADDCVLASGEAHTMREIVESDLKVFGSRPSGSRS